MKKLSLLLVIFISAVFSCIAQENEIKRIPNRGFDPEQNQYITFDKGFWGAAEVSGGYSAHLHGHNLGLTELDVMAGYRFNQFLRIGLGIGARYYFDKHHIRRGDTKWGMPLFGDIRGSFMSSTYRKVVPYWDVAIGASIRDGFFFRPTLGLKIGEPRQAFLIGVSYMGQELATLNNLGQKTHDYTSIFCLKLGFEY